MTQKPKPFYPPRQIPPSACLPPPCSHPGSSQPHSPLSSDASPCFLPSLKAPLSHTQAFLLSSSSVPCTPVNLEELGIQHCPFPFLLPSDPIRCLFFPALLFPPLCPSHILLFLSFPPPILPPKPRSLPFFPPPSPSPLPYHLALLISPSVCPFLCFPGVPACLCARLPVCVWRVCVSGLGWRPLHALLLCILRHLSVGSLLGLPGFLPASASGSTHVSITQRTLEGLPHSRCWDADVNRAIQDLVFS